jgi:protein disulfide isomerase family A protein 3
MDATENDVPSSYEVRGFPTIFFAPKNDKNNPRKYEVRFEFSQKIFLMNFVYLGCSRS